jgi:uncharacterized membrane protein YeaQ/YmgE (transglycosylase-associated protein family)
LKRSRRTAYSRDVGICGWMVFGFFAGLVARAITPGYHRMGLIRTTLLGVGGSFVGGVLGAVISGQDPIELHASGFIGAVIGAIVLLLISGWLSRSRPA